MIRYLVVLGTTRFDSLLLELDRLGKSGIADFVFQVPCQSYLPESGTVTKFQPELFQKFPEIPVICHCGAGSVFELLEIGRDFIAIPNLDRQDHHQIELADYLKANHLALVASDIGTLRLFIEQRQIREFQRKPYRKESFFLQQEITALIT